VWHGAGLPVNDLDRGAGREQDGRVLAQFWDWVSGVFGRIGDVSFYWLVAALALKTAESALIAVGWRNILRAAYPRSGLVQDRLGSIAGRDCPERRHTGAGGHGGNDWNLPHEHQGLVGCRGDFRDGRPGALLHRGE
jgi:hypothetical protein